MKRLYFLTPDAGTAEQIIVDLEREGVGEEHVQVVANESQELTDLPEASHTTRSDIVPALQRGIALGGTAGVLAGLAAVSFPVAGVTLGGGALLYGGLLGASSGAWASAMVGASVPNTQLQQFEDAVDSGLILMLVDVENEREKDIRRLVRLRHPEATFGGIEPSLKLVPAEATGG